MATTRADRNSFRNFTTGSTRTVTARSTRSAPMTGTWRRLTFRLPDPASPAKVLPRARHFLLSFRGPFSRHHQIGEASDRVVDGTDRRRRLADPAWVLLRKTQPCIVVTCLVRLLGIVVP